MNFTSVSQTAIHKLQFCLVLAAMLSGCENKEPPVPVGEQPAPAPSLPELIVQSPLRTQELVEFVFRPVSASPDTTLVDLVFASENPLPEGAGLDPSTGTLTWTPTEAQGPGQYPFAIRYWAKENPSETTVFSFELDVVEQNSAPSIEIAKTAKGDAGKLLEIPIQVSDVDFPSNEVHVRIAEGSRYGIEIDTISGLLRWQIPIDWKQRQVTLSITAVDNGRPPLRAERTLTIDVQTSTVVAEEKKDPDDIHRSPTTYLELPEVPRPGDQSMPVEIPIADFHPMQQLDSLRLSLLIPDELKDRFTVKYAEDNLGHFSITTTEPFEAESQDIELPKQTIADCRLAGDKLVWMWALTKNLRVRALQNNIRECVLSIEDAEGQSLWLGALQQVEHIANLSLSILFGDDELKHSLFRKPKTAVVAPLIAKDLRLMTGSGRKIPCEAKLEDHWLVSKITGLSEAPEVAGIELRFFAYPTEVGLQFGSDPSIERANETMKAARGILISLNGKLNRTNRKLNSAGRAYRAAQAIRVSTQADERLKSVKLRQAQADINKCQAELAQLSVEIPKARALVLTQEAEFEKLASQLAPLRGYIVCGELCRIVSDVRVVVVEMEKVKLPEEPEQNAQR